MLSNDDFFFYGVSYYDDMQGKQENTDGKVRIFQYIAMQCLKLKSIPEYFNKNYTFKTDRYKIGCA